MYYSTKLFLLFIIWHVAKVFFCKEIHRRYTSISFTVNLQLYFLYLYKSTNVHLILL